MCLGIPAQVVEVTSDGLHLATVEVAGLRRIVNVGLLPDDQGLRPGEWVLVHTNLALGRLDEDQAIATLQFLREIGEACQDEPVPSRARERRS